MLGFDPADVFMGFLGLRSYDFRCLLWIHASKPWLCQLFLLEIASTHQISVA